MTDSSTAISTQPVHHLDTDAELACGMYPLAGGDRIGVLVSQRVNDVTCVPCLHRLLIRRSFSPRAVAE